MDVPSTDYVTRCDTANYGMRMKAEAWPILCARQEISTFCVTIKFAMEELRVLRTQRPETAAPYSDTKQFKKPLHVQLVT